MVGFNLLTVNLLYAIFFVVPGLLGLKIYLKIAEKVDSYTRLDAIIYSLGISIISVFVLYVVYGIWLWNLPQFNDVRFSELPIIMGVYVAHVVASCVTGVAIGKIDARRSDRGDQKTRRELWDFAFDDIYSDTRIRVTTLDGRKIEGTVAKMGETAQSQDLILVSAYELHNPEDEDAKKAEELGEYTYIHEQDISTIQFPEDLNEDLDMETLRSLGYAPMTDDESIREDVDEELEEEIEDELERELPDDSDT